MNTRLYVGNLSGNITEKSLQDLFSQKGSVTEVKLMMDQTTGLSRGFAFITMGTPEAAQAALQAFHSTKLGERYITVTEARPQKEIPSGFLIGGSGPDRNNRFNKSHLV